MKKYGSDNGFSDITTSFAVTFALSYTLNRVIEVLANGLTLAVVTGSLSCGSN